MSAALLALAGTVAAPMIRRLLEDKIGGGDVQIATEVLGLVAKEAGVPVDFLDQFAADNPDEVAAAIEAVDPMVPEMIALYAKGLEFQMAALKAEEGDPYWMRAWRPGMMYMLGLLWLWNVIFLHIANAVWKIALPPMEVSHLITLTGILGGLYMGGHTAKDMMASWATRGMR